MGLEKLYLVTMSVLILHQIDAAYWKEWEMFNFPGEIQGFLLFNLLVVPVVLFGYGKVITRSSTAKVFSYICGFLGIITFLIHTALMMLGIEGFSLPLSIVIICLCFIFGFLLVLKTKIIYK